MLCSGLDILTTTAPLSKEICSKHCTGTPLIKYNHGGVKMSTLTNRFDNEEQPGSLIKDAAMTPVFQNHILYV